MDGKGTDDRRMHEGDKPGLFEGRGHERHEEPLADADNIGTGDGHGSQVRRAAEEALEKEEGSPGGHFDAPSGLGVNADEER